VDSLGNLKQQTSPDTGSTDAVHDEAGNLTTRTDARGKTAAYSYDSLDRLSKIVYDDQTVNYTWDSCANGIGRLCSLSNNTVSHSYNAAGQRTRSLSPGGQTLDYQWTGNRITALSVNCQPVISQITYEPDGQVNGWTWGNTQPNERFYDLAGRAVIVSLGFDAKTQLPDSRYYGYDAAGRLTDAIDDVDPQLNQHHAYDELDRLTGSRRGEPELSRIDYSYDLSGNRTEKIKNSTTQNSYSTDANSNRLQSQGGAQTASYSYDAAGNLTGDGTFSYSYNAAGRRIAATSAGQTVSYGYDGLGQRITKTVAGNTTQYFYDEQGHLTGEYDGSGQLIQEIIWLGDLPVAMLKPSATTAIPDLYYIHADHLGTPRKITRPNDNRVVWSWESEAFGNSLPDQNPSGLGDFVFNLRFPGQYYDAETGLHYNMARYYNPKTGRYDESDPIGLKGGVNTYAYVKNNPINFIDPKGLNPVAAAIVLCELNPVACVAATAAAAEAAKAAAKGVEACWNAMHNEADNSESTESSGNKGKKSWPPSTGPENGYEEGPRRGREYNENGDPKRDYDKPHQGAPYDHVHEWEDGVREHPGRPYSPWPQK